MLEKERQKELEEEKEREIEIEQEHFEDDGHKRHDAGTDQHTAHDAVMRFEHFAKLRGYVASPVHDA